ncbi:hypothetical protein N2152v2_000395 [Parachlorella kessleri]
MCTVCQVVGCQSQTPKKIYYQRHKICLHHANLEALVLDGQSMRWCQQCGRFQPLGDFDGTRKTCRTVLKQHNLRRQRRNTDFGGGHPAAQRRSPSASTATNHPKDRTAPPADCHGKPGSPALQLPASATLRSASSLEDTWASNPPPAAPSEQPKALGRTRHGGPCRRPLLRSTVAGRSSSAGSSPKPPATWPCQPASTPSVAANEVAAPHSKPSMQDDRLPAGPFDGEPETAWLPQVPQPLPAAQPAAAPVACDGEGVSSLGQSSLISTAWPFHWEEADGSSWDPLADELLGSLAELDAAMDLLPSQGRPTLADSSLERSLACADMLLAPSDAASAIPEWPPATQPNICTPAPGTLLPSQVPPATHAIDLRALPGGAGTGVSCLASVPATMTAAMADMGARGGSRAARASPQAGSPPPGTLCESQLLGSVHPAPAGLVGPAVEAAGGASYAAAAAAAAAGAAAAGVAVGVSAAARASSLVAPSPGLEEEPWQVLSSLEPDMPAGLGPEVPASHALPGGQVGVGSPSTLSQDSIVRLSLKIFDSSPDRLPPHVLQEVVNLVSADPVFVDSFVRPGCTHITVSALLAAAERERLEAEGCASLTRRLLQCSGWLANAGAEGEPWAANMLIQLGSQVAVVRQGRLAAVGQAPVLAPTLLAARPEVMLAQNAGQGGASAPGPDPYPPAGSIRLWGYNLGGATRPGRHDAIICRQAGRLLTLEVLAHGRGDPGEIRDNPAEIRGIPAGIRGDPGEMRGDPAEIPGPPAVSPPPEWVLVRPLGVGVGLLEFEDQRGGFLSEAVAVVAVPGETAVEEAQQAQRCLAGTPHGTAFLQQLGLTLQHLHPSGASRGGTVNAHSKPPHPRASALAEGLLVMARSAGWAGLSTLLSEALASVGEHHRCAMLCGTDTSASQGSAPGSTGAAGHPAVPQPQRQSQEPPAAASEIQRLAARGSGGTPGAVGVNGASPGGPFGPLKVGQLLQQQEQQQEGHEKEAPRGMTLSVSCGTEAGGSMKSAEAQEAGADALVAGATVGGKGAAVSGAGFLEGSVWLSPATPCSCRLGSLIGQVGAVQRSNSCTTTSSSCSCSSGSLPQCLRNTSATASLRCALRALFGATGLALLLRAEYGTV